MFKKGIFLVLSTMLLLTSCDFNDYDANSASELKSDNRLIDCVIDMGFREDMIEDKGDYFLVEGDIILYKDNINPQTRQYRTEYLVSDYTNITVRIDDSLPDDDGIDDWRDEIEQAINEWNKLSTLKMALTTSTDADITIRSDNYELDDLTLANACFPNAQGEPGDLIRINLDYDSNMTLATGQKLKTTVHELGHCIGFRHTNWSALDESPAIHIDVTIGTDAESVMNGGNPGSYWNGFSYYDIVATRALYGAEGSILPAMFVYKNGSIRQPSNGSNLYDYKDFITELIGGSGSVITTYTITNLGEENLILDGPNPVSLDGPGSLVILNQPASPILSGESSTFQIQYSTDSTNDFGARIDINSNDPVYSSYEFGVLGYGVPLAYHNPCDNINDLTNYDTGGFPVYTERGGYTSYIFEPFINDNGLRVYNHSKSKSDYAQMIIYPFSNSKKPEFSKGSCSFWAQSTGKWRGRGNDTYISSNVYFYLTSDTYVRIYGPAKSENTTIYFYFHGNLVKTIVINKYARSHFFFQWDFDGFMNDSSHLKFYLNGSLRSSQISSSKEADAAEIQSFLQYFKLKCRTDNGGDYRPSGVKAIIDDIKIWTDVIGIDDFEN